MAPLTAAASDRDRPAGTDEVDETPAESPRPAVSRRGRRSAAGTGEADARPPSGTWAPDEVPASGTRGGVLAAVARRRRSLRATETDPGIETSDVAEGAPPARRPEAAATTAATSVAAPSPASGTEPPERSERRRRRTAAEGTAAAPAAAATMHIPERRNRWSGRIADASPRPSTNGDAHHDFADLAPAATVATTAPSANGRRRPQVEAPLDAPGLDVPDPAPRARPRPARTPATKAKAPLPTRAHPPQKKPAARS